MPIRSALLILSSVMLSGCLEALALARPVGVPLNLPPNLGQCEEAVATSEPTTFVSVGRSAWSATASSAPAAQR